MTTPVEPEIIPPKRRRVPVRISDEQLDHLATLLDDIFRLPGTSIRFGLDPLIGLIPGLGDLITGAMSFLIVYGAWQRGVPRVTMVRMFVNIAIDTLGGIIPIAGDAFDVFWKSNRMNYNLLQRARAGNKPIHSIKDWLFLMVLAVAMLALLAIPIVLLLLVVHWVRQRAW